MADEIEGRQVGQSVPDWVVGVFRVFLGVMPYGVATLAWGIHQDARTTRLEAQVERLPPQAITEGLARVETNLERVLDDNRRLRDRLTRVEVTLEEIRKQGN